MNFFRRLSDVSEHYSHWVANSGVANLGSAGLGVVNLAAPASNTHPSADCQTDLENSSAPAITIHETKTQLVLEVQLSERDFSVFDVQVTPDKILLLGHWLEKVAIQGYFCPRPFEKWILLPHTVYPETLWIESESQHLLLQLVKRGERSTKTSPKASKVLLSSSSSTPRTAKARNQRTSTFMSAAV